MILRKKYIYRDLRGNTGPFKATGSPTTCLLGLSHLKGGLNNVSGIWVPPSSSIYKLCDLGQITSPVWVQRKSEKEVLVCPISGGSGEIQVR